MRRPTDVDATNKAGRRDEQLFIVGIVGDFRVRALERMAMAMLIVRAKRVNYSALQYLGFRFLVGRQAYAECFLRPFSFTLQVDVWIRKGCNMQNDDGDVVDLYIPRKW